MPHDTLYTVLDWTSKVLAPGCAYTMLMTHLTAPRTHKQYVHRTLTIGSFGLMTIITLVQAALVFAEGDYPHAGRRVTSAAFLMLCIWYLIKGGDNWFNDQSKRLKRGAKKLRERLAAAMPTPAPAPA